MKRTARGDLVWPVLGFFILLGLVRGIDVSVSTDTAHAKPQAFITEVESDPFASIAEMR